MWEEQREWFNQTMKISIQVQNSSCKLDMVSCYQSYSFQWPTQLAFQECTSLCSFGYSWHIGLTKYFYSDTIDWQKGSPNTWLNMLHLHYQLQSFCTACLGLWSFHTHWFWVLQLIQITGAITLNISTQNEWVKITWLFSSLYPLLLSLWSYLREPLLDFLLCLNRFVPIAFLECK